jgi:uncharacterized protein (DUF433 family)
MDYKSRITLESGKRSGKPCIRGMRITVQDVLSYLASGMTQEQVLADFPYLEKEDILACLAYAADRSVSRKQPHCACWLARNDDRSIWQYCLQEGFVVVSKDNDFGFLASERGAPPKAIWIRLGNCTTDEVETAILGE